MGSINVDQLSLALVNQLDAYRDLTVEGVTWAVEHTASATANEINQSAAELFNGNEYRGSWAWKRDKSLRGKWNYSAVVYSRKPYYRIAHLLENGHAKVNGGFVEGRPHIAPAAKRAEQILTMYIKQAIADIRAGRTDWRGK